MIDAGRPLSEIMNEAKRLSAEDLPRCGGHSAGQQTIERSNAALCNEEDTGEQLAFTRAAVAPLQTRGELRRIWPITAVILLSTATGLAGTAHVPRPTPITTTNTPATTPTPALLPIRSPADASTASDREPSGLTAAQIKALVQRGTTLLARGDLARARLVYEPAVRAGDAQAAVYLGATYDRYFLKRGLGRAVRGDLRLAEYWYQRARELSASRDAEAQLGNGGKRSEAYR